MEALIQVPTLGGIVLIDERKPDLSYRLVQQRSLRRKKVLCVSREPPERIARRHPMELAEYHWLITGDGDQSVSPFRLDAVLRLVERFLAENRQGTVLLDGVELLMIMNSYEGVRDLLFALHELGRRSEGDCVVPIDTRTLTTKELAELRDAFPMIRGNGR